MLMLSDFIATFDIFLLIFFFSGRVMVSLVKQCRYFGFVSLFYIPDVVLEMAALKSKLINKHAVKMWITGKLRLS